MLTLRAILNIVQGVASSSITLDQEINRFSIDTCTLKHGDVFVALQGEVYHGNNFIDKAIQQGAIAIITDRTPESQDVPYVLVEDSLKALTQIGVYQRDVFKGNVCGITGSVGKSSVKEALSFTMRQIGITVHASEKSYNNHIGVPLTLANLDSIADIAVLEIGTNHPGEILALTKLVRPNVAIVTAVGPGHIAFFNSIEAIAKEKVSIAAALVDGGIAVLSAESEFFPLMEGIVTQKYHRAVMSFGTTDKSDVRAASVDVSDAKLHVTAVISNTEISYTLPTSNYAWVSNSLAILAVVHALSLDVKQAAAHLANIPLMDGRGRVYTLKVEGKQTTLIDDAYNSNPLSLKAALETLSRYEGRKVAVIGDMRELGDSGEYYHTEIGQLCKSLKIDQVLTCGTLMEHAFKELADHQRLGHVEDYTKVLDVLSARLMSGDVVLLKASNGVNLHKVVVDLLAGQTCAQ